MQEIQPEQTREMHKNFIDFLVLYEMTRKDGTMEETVREAKLASLSIIVRGLHQRLSATSDNFVFTNVEEGAV